MALNPKGSLLSQEVKPMEVRCDKFQLLKLEAFHKFKALAFSSIAANSGAQLVSLIAGRQAVSNSFTEIKSSYPPAFPIGGVR